MLFYAPIVRADEVEVSATLSQSAVEVGQTVQLQLKIIGARSGEPPAEIRVDGLDINYGGRSTQVQMNNFNITSSVVHSYLIVPQRAGAFTIPGQTVEVGGKKYVTKPVTLTVGGSAATAPPGGAPANARQVFAELIVPKQTAYVGEVIPVELRVYVDTRIRWQPEQPPTIGGEGFTAQKFTNPQQNEVRRDGRVYDAAIYKTAVTPAKAGQLSLGPAQLECVAQIPQPRRRARTGSPFDDFFNDDAFADVFGFGPARQLQIKAEAAAIEVKPLPTAGQPKNFGGAVGQFSLEVSAAPKRVKSGDPITLRTSVSGRGNFDRVTAPGIRDESGWRAYPPSAKFKADDDVGISGVKTFEAALIPEAGKTKLPNVQFVYFDPTTEKYVTLNGAEIPISVEPGAAPLATAPSAANVQPPNAHPAASPAPSAAPNDILYIRTDAPANDASFIPLYRTRGFWFAQLVPLAGLLTFAVFQVAAAKRCDVSRRQVAQWRREKEDSMKTLMQPGLDEVSFLESATKFLRLDTALRTNRDAAALDAREICSARGLEEATAERVKALFAAHAESRYAGAGRVGTGLASEKRTEIIETLRAIEKSDARA